MNPNDDLLTFAVDWKAGRTDRVHPSVGRRLNQSLVAAGQDPVPFARATTLDTPSLVEILKRDYARP